MIGTGAKNLGKICEANVDIGICGTPIRGSARFEVQ